MRNSSLGLLLGFTLITSTIFAQIITLNDGFEGPRKQGIAPYPWSNSSDGFSSGDTQPGAFNNNKEAHEGSTYVSLVTRALSQPGTVETIWCELLQPFEINRCYNLQIDLSLSQEFKASWGFEDVYFDKPFRLRLIGFNGDINNPQEEEILWESEIINNFDWETYQINFTPMIAAYNRIALRPAFINDATIENSVIFIDNLRLEESALSLVDKDGVMTIPPGSTAISWYFDGVKVETQTPFQMPGLGNGHYVVSFFDPGNCFRKTSAVLEFNSDKLEVYPNPSSDFITIKKYSTLRQSADLRIYNELGQLVNTFPFPLEMGYSTLTIDLNHLAEASYFISLVPKDGKELAKKIVVMR